MIMNTYNLEVEIQKLRNEGVTDIEIVNLVASILDIGIIEMKIVPKVNLFRAEKGNERVEDGKQNFTSNINTRNI